MICEYCRRIIGKKPVLFVNKLQIPSTHFFCSKYCKDWWCFDSQGARNRSVVAWCIGRYLHKYFFVKKVDEKKGSNAKITFFSEKLSQIKELELTGSKILKVRKMKI